MVSVIRTAYGYSDEYIMAKPVRWVRNSYELCLRESYNNNLQLAHLVMHLYAASMSKEVKPPLSFGEMIKQQRVKKEEPQGMIWFSDDNKLNGFGIKVKTPKPKKSPEKGTEPPPSSEETATQ